ncbi:MAG: fibronectin type III domain-containing protein [Spirochaetes bacterium]|nr:fibronectin type III domain-containing protein [Spirochaetota bacterium]
MTVRTNIGIIIFCSALLSPCQAGEKTLRVDALTVVPSSPYQWLLDGVVMAPGYRGRPDIVLGRAAPMVQSACDLLVDFDDAVPRDATGRWSLSAAGAYRRLSSSRAFTGQGAGGFAGPGSGIVMKPSGSELFGSGLHPADFSMEFRINPSLAANGETLLLWKGAMLLPEGPFTQRITCVVERGRLSWTFENFFQPSGGAPARTTVSLKGTSLLVPKTWSHHLVRYDSATGLVEYLMNGLPEAIAYATPTGRENASVFRPRTGSASAFELAPDFTGIVDDLAFRTDFLENPELSRYGRQSGVAISPIIDLGNANTELRGMEAEYRAANGADVEFSFRCADDTTAWREGSPAWIPFAPGASLPGKPRGRYVQLRIELFPDGSGSSGPAFSGLTVRYVPDLAPPPPASVVAAASDGSVALAWSRVNESDLGGYLVYYGDAPGSYFGTDAALGSSPLDVGRVQTATVNGLANGKRYYFVIVAYDTAPSRHEGEFSVEASARPARTGR